MRSLIALFCLGSGFSLAAATKPPTLAEARAFLDRAQAKLLELSVQDSRADWVKSTFITYDTEILAAKADQDQIAATMQLAKESTRFSRLKMPEDMAREFKLLRLSLTLAAPSDPKEAAGADTDRIPDGRHLWQRQVLCQSRVNAWIWIN